MKRIWLWFILIADPWRGRICCVSVLSFLYGGFPSCQGRVRPGHRGLHQGGQASPKMCRAIHETWARLQRKRRCRSGHRGFHKGHRARSGGCEAYKERGVAYGKREEYESEIEDYRKAIELDPKYAVAYFNLGVAHARKQDYDLAIEDYTKAIELDRELRESIQQPGSGPCAKDNRTTRPIADYTTGDRARSEIRESIQQPREAYSCDREEPDRAMEDYDKAIELDPKLAMAYNNRGMIFLPGERSARAIEEFDQGD